MNTDPENIDGPPELSPAVAWVRPAGAVHKLYDEVESQLRRKRARTRRRVAGVVGAAVIACAAFVLFRPVAMPLPNHSAPVVSLPASRELPDRSRVEFVGETAIAVQFSESERRVQLDAGTAHFEVMKDASRPFVVVANGVRVRAVGTAFSVSLVNGEVDVIVTEGRVAVERDGQTAADALSAGERIIVRAGVNADDTHPVRLEASELSQRLAWRAPRVEFSATALRDAVAVFQQHAKVRIEYSDASIGEVELSGLLRADNVDSLVHMLQEQFGIRADRDGDVIRLSR